MRTILQAKRLAKLLGLTFLVVSCERVLGMGPPRLEPCAVDDCVGSDAQVVVHASEDAQPAPEASGSTRPPEDPPPPTPDASLPAPPTLVKCGGTGLTCSSGNQICCATFNSVFSYSCIDPKTSCAGSPIGCAKQPDCPAPTVCCDLGNIVSCVTPGTCKGTLLCDPAAVPSQCPADFTCNRANDPSWTYFGCTH